MKRIRVDLGQEARGNRTGISTAGAVCFSNRNVTEFQPRSHIFLVVLTAGMVIAATLFGAGASQAADDSNRGDYQIVKATGDRVWRLNKSTGEIAVCTLDGDNLICTTSTEAIKPPSKTFAERQAEKQQAEAAAAKQRDRDRAKDLAFLDRALLAIKSLIQAAMERDAPAEETKN